MFITKFTNEGYIDLHSHIIPGADDGASDMETAVAMLDMAHDDGIRTIVATPHYHPNKTTISNKEVYEKFLEFKNEAKRLHPDMTLLFGREIYGSFDAVEKLSDSREYLSLCGSRYALIEFAPSADYRYMVNLLRNVMMNGFTPLLAHVERYECLLSDIDRVRELRDMNLLIQVNAMSLVGDCPRDIKNYVNKLLKENMIDIAATDAHTTKRRCPRMRKAAKAVAGKYGREISDKLFIKNPEKIIKEGKMV